MKQLTKAVIAAAVIGAAGTFPINASSCAAGMSAGKDEACSAGKTVVALAQGSDQFKTLVAALTAADLVGVLQGDGPFTVFAPTDEAFAKLPAGTVENLLKPENKAQLVAVLKYHVLAGKVMAKDVKTMQATTVQGQKMSIEVKEGGVFVDNAKVVKTDLLADNGVIHVIDAVILPKS
jgi:uncharacterized surface protein with fasciclin (FAS1) repeats